EYELDTLPGYDGAAPVRVGNEAYRQFQLDSYGLVMVALDVGRATGVPEDKFSWPLQTALLQYLAENWHRPDRGIWEIRGRSQHFTNSRAMVWAAFDRGIRAAEAHGLRGPVDRWRRIRARLAEEIESKGFHAGRGHYVQHTETAE